jgi:hypothetical protein
MRIAAQRRRLILLDEQNDFGDHHRRFPSIDFCQPGL